jgi:hypothetical protein
MQTPSSGNVPRGQSAESRGSLEPEGADVGAAPTRKILEELRNAVAPAARSAARTPTFTSGDMFFFRVSAPHCAPRASQPEGSNAPAAPVLVWRGSPSMLVDLVFQDQ